MWNRIAVRARESQARRPSTEFTLRLAQGDAEPAQASRSVTASGGRVRLAPLLLACWLFPAAAPGPPAGRAGATQRAGAAELHKVRAESYQIDVRLQAEQGFLSAKAALTLEALVPVEAIELELNPRLNIKDITDGPGRKLAFDRSPRIGSPKLLVRLAEPCRPGQRITLTFVYAGAPLLRGLDYLNKDGILLRDDSRWYPVVDLSAFTENDITIELPPGWDAFTSGERSGSASAPDRPGPPIRSVDSDGAHRSGFWTPMESTGLQKSETPGIGDSGNQSRHAGGTNQVYRWKTLAPVSSRSLVAFPTGSHYLCDAHSSEEPAQPDLHSTVSSCFDREQRESFRRLQARVSSLLDWDGKMLGVFANRELTLVQAFPKAQGAIGYSAPGLLAISEDVVKFSDDPNYMPEFLPHEIAHQWFPIQVTLERQEDGWLAESLAEYLAWRYLQEKSPEHARALVARALRDALAEQPLLPLQEGLRLFALPDWQLTYATLYQRGMLVFRTLETVVDRERLDRALREYYRRFAGRPASVADFRKICQEVSGRDLGWFFDYFLKGTQVPEIALRQVLSPAPGEAAGEIVVRNVPPEFSVRVEMRLDTTRGPLDHSVATRGEVTPFAVSVPGEVTRITLDPNARILRWTEAARRNRKKRALLAKLDKRESERDYARALALCRQALAADPDDLAANHQQIRFACGRLDYRMHQWPQALRQFERVLALASLDRETTDFFRAWAHVYRARIEQMRHRPAAAGAEAQAGLAIRSAALETAVSWPESPDKRTTARDELERLAH
jgi:tetratricopeptide (TPR) repeat protein